jgi:glycosyltransferase involved in cell wall biosynthesis
MVSVIIPNYNHAKFLDKRIQSVLNQTYQDFEVIILDDYSIDNSRDIIEKYRQNKKISAIIYNETNSGSTFKQWKKGIENAKGEYIWIAESDDYAAEVFLERTVFLIKRYNTGLVFTDSILIDENDNEFLGWKLPSFDSNNDGGVWDTSNKQEKYFDGNLFVTNYLIKNNNIHNASAVLFVKEKAIKITDIERFHFCGDWYFWVNMLLGSSVIFCNEKLNFFRQHTQKVSSNAARLGLTYLEGLDISVDIINRLHFTFLKILLAGKDIYYEIKKDNLILDEKIRRQCFEKWLNLFPYAKIILAIHPLLSVIEITINKKRWFNERLKENGLLETIKYYFYKYFKGVKE